MSTGTPETLSAWRTIRRGLRESPEFTRGLALTVLLAVASTAGRVVVPVTVQRAIDDGLRPAGSSGPDLELLYRLVLLAAGAVLLTAVCGYLMNIRLYRSAESGLAALRTKAFRHVHDLSVLHQNAERRGALVARVTSDVDTISQFVQWGGVLALVSVGQLLLATVLMAAYSWQLTLVVLVCFLPLAALLRTFQRWLAGRYVQVRERVGDMLSAISESVMGASVVRSYGVEARTGARMDSAVVGFRTAQERAQRLVALTFPTGEVLAALATGLLVAVGVLLGVGGDLTFGELVAFLFLANLFLAPIQLGTEVLNEAQNAASGWRRVLALLDARPDVVDPGPAGRRLPPGPLDIRFERVSYAYPGGDTVLHGVDLTIQPGTRVAVVGRTGSGKSTFARLLTRLTDPADGRVLIGGVDLTEVPFASLRERVGLVPQEGFLVDDTLRENLRYGRSDASDQQIQAALTELGLADWLTGLSRGLDTPVGQRGESLSAGERQLVALARAYLTSPDLLVLDEATSSVDPATETRLQRALDSLARGRTSVSIAHRLSTAEGADEMLVFDAGRVVERGHHRDLVARGGVYARLHESWSAQQRLG